ncbi:hypothetical protein HMN09_00771300 [Mycena chlorophos]|uniref:Uncharacterized protein n=1 Tax=Mycena chlorophos TaxID=658473 RepID=A0A8H6SYB5_MYCCL|nr:hypothetical protein HMN09_00771300 [Mycena chlorophos]
MYRLFAALVAASAVSGLSISTQCQGALTSVAANTDANSCLGISALTTAFLETNTSFIPQVTNMVNTICSAQPCSNATLSAVVANITNGCSAEISAAGGSSSDGTATVTSIVEQYYSVARQMLCLKDNGDSGTNCLVQTLTNLQNTYGTFSVSGLSTTLANIEGAKSFPANITCTNCLKEAYNLLNESFPATAGTFESEVNSVCGSNFTDGSAPSNIVETAASTKTDNGAKSLDGVFGAGTLGTLIASSFLAMLA